ncbi:MAG: flagellar biosynthetic protein FliO [Piscirickettsiaceae bacterium]|nr:flagellar biosynthetic protein FliO [Piscirickettsiaceae bacterium]
MKQFIHLIYGLILSLISNISFAATSDEKLNPTSTLATPVGASALVETLLGLLLVLVTIAFLAWLLRRTGRFQASANGEMKIIAGLSLGSRERAILLQVGEQQILVGVTPQQIRTLHILEKPIPSDNTDGNTSGFAEKLQQMMKKQAQS